LLFIVDSDEGQREAYLVTILARHPYAGGGTWWERLQPHVFFAELVQVVNLVPPAQTKIFWDKFYEMHPERPDFRLSSTLISPEQTKTFTDLLSLKTLTTADQEITEQNSTPEVAKTENIDDILFGYILSEEDREDIAIMKHRAGIV
jgi:hypothetical protein